MKRILSAAVRRRCSVIGSSAVPRADSAGPARLLVRSRQPGEGNGGLIFWAYDATRNVSIVDYLGLSFNDVVPTGTDMNTPGKVLDCGNIGSPASTFAASRELEHLSGVSLRPVTSSVVIHSTPHRLDRPGGRGTVDAGAMNFCGSHRCGRQDQ